MNNLIIEATDKRLEASNEKDHWLSKAENFLNSVLLLNSEVLIEDQIQKLLCVGVKSIYNSAKISQELTKEVLGMIESELKPITGIIGVLTEKFNTLTGALTQKKSFFTTKQPEDIFFELFAKQEITIEGLIKELTAKDMQLVQLSHKLEESINEINEVYFLLERDVRVLNLIDRKLGHTTHSGVNNVYKRYLSDVKIKQTDLLTHQQLILQKYAALCMLQDNLSNCSKNIKTITKVTYSVVHNTVELQKIISLNKANLSPEQTQALQKLKESFIVVNTDFKIIANQPFAAHN